MSYTVMTVCTGNICRSPMAEVALQAALAEADLESDVTVISRGVSDEEAGNGMDPRARHVLKQAGYHVGEHTARQVTVADIGKTDLALAMTAQHARQLRALGFPDEKVALYRAFADGAPAVDPHTLSAPDTPDPWYGGQEDFAATLHTVQECTPGVVAYLSEQV